MKIFKAASLLTAVLVAAACATAPPTRISSSLAGSDFNSASSQYLARPTFISILPSETSPTLLVEMTPYNGYNPTLGIEQPWRVPFEQKYVADYLPLIDKYFEWEELASSRGDAIGKEIGRARSSSGFGSGGAELRFTFFSGNASSHDLVVGQCLATCLDPIHFSKTNVVELRRLLVEFQQNRLQTLNVDSVYK